MIQERVRFRNPKELPFSGSVMDETLSQKSPRFPHTALLVLTIGLIAVILIVFFSFSPLLSPTSKIDSFDQAKTLANEYLVGVGSGLEIKEVEEWTNNFYVRVQEKNTGINAFELLVDRYSGRVMPEPGPNMMWNQKYGMMGGMMGRFQGTSTVNMTVNTTRAAEIAQKWLDSNFPSANVEDPDTYYGYYTIDFSKGGSTIGMLSVNGYTGDVWYHSWHGSFIDRVEYG
jgi:hypothetical protein